MAISKQSREITWLTTDLKSHHVVIIDRYWCIDPETGRPFAFHNAPQCGVNEETMMRVRDRLYPWAAVKKLHAVCVPLGWYT